MQSTRRQQVSYCLDGTCVADIVRVSAPPSIAPIGIPTAREFFFSDAPLDTEAWAAREKAFFRSIRLKNGTFKTTYAHRLDSLNEIVSPLLSRDHPLEIMDVAVSSGIATLEWMESLRAADIDFRMTAGDLCVRAFLLSFGSLLNVLVDRGGYPMQFDLAGRAIPYPPPRRMAVLLPLFVGLHALRWILPSIFAATFKRSAVDGQARYLRRLGVSCQHADLVSPRLRQQQSLTILDDDLLATGAYENRFHVIRAANVLNRSYFTEENLGAMIDNLRRRLRPGGMLIICRTHEDGTNHGTVYRLNAQNAFDAVVSIGHGSEVDPLVRQRRG